MTYLAQGVVNGSRHTCVVHVSRHTCLSAECVKKHVSRHTCQETLASAPDICRFLCEVAWQYTLSACTLSACTCYIKDKNKQIQAHSYAQAGAVCIAANKCAGVAQQRKQRLVLDHRSSAPGPGGTDVPGLQRCLQDMIRVC